MFTKDTRTETFLTQMGVDFKYTNSVTFEQLFAGWQQNNLARPMPVREEAVTEYAALMETGSPAPAPIFHKKPKWLDVLDGVQRLAAAQLINFTKLSGYIVTCDSKDVVTAIRILANARLQGRAEPAEWTRRRAVEVLVIDRKLSCQEVAKMGGWQAADIEAISRYIEWGFTIRCIGGPCLPDAMIEVIQKYTTEAEISKAPKPVAQFLETVKAAKFAAKDAEPFIEEFFTPIPKSNNRHKLYAERYKRFIEDPEVETRITGRRGRGLTPDVNLRRALRSTETIVDQIVTNKCDLAYMDEFFGILKRINEKLKRASKRHPKKSRAAVPADMWSEDAQT